MPTTTRAGSAIVRTLANPILREEITFLEISRETGGRHTLVDIRLAHGGGNSLHYHHAFSEEFTCLEGELSLTIGNRIIRLQPGESAVAPARSKHRFSNQSGKPCRFQCRFTPGLAGFEQALQLSYGLAQDGKTTAQGMPKNLFVIGYLALISGTYCTGVTMLLQPFLHWLGRQALRNGTAAELQRRYLTIW